MAPQRASSRMTTSSDTPMLDLDVVQALKELGGTDDPNLFNELVDLFVADASSNVSKLSSALEMHDVQTFQRVAHTLKSSSANVGAMRMSKLSFELEKLGRAGSLDGADALVLRMKREFDEVSAALTALRD